jgi:hypothetical protein
MASEAETKKKIVDLLNIHFDTFSAVRPYANETEQPVPMDTRAWSQILVSTITGIKGIARKKGADFADGSDVKAANVWDAIDTPRFNGVVKAGTKSKSSGSMDSLRAMPHLFFVLWDTSPATSRPRCRVWVVRPIEDNVFRGMCSKWYGNRTKGKITSINFQLHPPRNKDSNVFTNRCGNLQYPLLLSAERDKSGFLILTYDTKVLSNGACAPA